MKTREIDEKVALLKDGQIVEIDGLMFSAQRVNPNIYDAPCDICNLDCICRGTIALICAKLDLTSKTTWRLILESKVVYVETKYGKKRIGT